jgi:diadenosine tetraphosphatase ApaH/serine/threonine PP2A family protein phosphatase
MADVHSNIMALNTVLDGVDLDSVDSVICLGDVVGYGARPNECIDRLRNLDARVIAGNHDAAACGKMSTDYFNQHARRSAEWTGQQLTSSNREYLKQLPETLSDDQFEYYHGSPDGPLTEYVRSDRIAAGALEAIKAPKLAVGHTHQPVIYRFRQGTMQGKPIRGNQTINGITSDEQLVINPGSIGQPRDGDPRAAYLLVEKHGNGRMDLTWNRVEYNIATTQERIRTAGLPSFLASRLERGK